MEFNVICVIYFISVKDDGFNFKAEDIFNIVLLNWIFPREEGDANSGLFCLFTRSLLPLY
jgi:hypothetical protein